MFCCLHTEMRCNYIDYIKLYYLLRYKRDINTSGCVFFTEIKKYKTEQMNSEELETNFVYFSGAFMKTSYLIQCLLTSFEESSRS